MATLAEFQQEGKFAVLKLTVSVVAQETAVHRRNRLAPNRPVSNGNGSGRAAAFCIDQATYAANPRQLTG